MENQIKPGTIRYDNNLKALVIYNNQEGWILMKTPKSHKNKC